MQKRFRYLLNDSDIFIDDREEMALFVAGSNLEPGRKITDSKTSFSIRTESIEVDRDRAFKLLSIAREYR